MKVKFVDVETNELIFEDRIGFKSQMPPLIPQSTIIIDDVEYWLGEDHVIQNIITKPFGKYSITVQLQKT